MKRGFTLIELLVVISIISLLSTVVLGSLNSARQESRNALKKQQLTQVMRALQQYHITKGQIIPNEHTNWMELHLDYSGDANTDPVMQPLITAGYLSAIPISPDSNPYYYYNYGTYIMLASRMTPMENGPGTKGWHCSNFPSDKIWCLEHDI